jgi:hypothetical protein
MRHSKRTCGCIGIGIIVGEDDKRSLSLAMKILNLVDHADESSIYLKSKRTVRWGGSACGAIRGVDS